MKLKKKDFELGALRLKVAEVEKSREEDLASYRKMVGGFLKAFKSEVRRILHAQNPELDLSEIEKVSPSDLAKVAAEEEAAKKSASRQRKEQRVAKKKTTAKEPSSEPSTDPNLPREEISVGTEPSVVVENQPVNVSLGVGSVPPESEINVGSEPPESEA